jgi:hypothetical protein
MKVSDENTKRARRFSQLLETKLELIERPYSCSFDISDGCSESQEVIWQLNGEPICTSCLVDKCWEEINLLLDDNQELRKILDSLIKYDRCINTMGFAPCPFCGAYDEEAISLRVDSEGTHRESFYVYCENCEATGPWFPSNLTHVQGPTGHRLITKDSGFEAKKDAVKGWNNHPRWKRGAIHRPPPNGK